MLVTATMIQFTFVTRVDASLMAVAQNFNQELLLKLKPPLISMELVQYDGQCKGDQIKFNIGIGPFKQHWHGHITAHRYTKKHWLFRDEDIALPHPIKKWKHTHALMPLGENTLVIDRIKFEGKNRFYTLILCLPFIAMFYMRKPLYKRHLR